MSRTSLKTSRISGDVSRSMSSSTTSMGLSRAFRRLSTPLSATADPFFPALKNFCQNLYGATQTLGPRTDKRQPAHPGKDLAVGLQISADIGKVAAEFQLNGEFREKQIDEVVSATEHPGVEVENRNSDFFPVGPRQVDERCLPRSPGTEDTYDNALARIQR